MKILVVGDVMLDVYVEGVVNRISPEAPVPVLHIANETEYPGGAANVARNIESLNGACTLISVVGNDTAAKTIKSHMYDHRIRTEFLVDEARWTTVKRRYEASRQQILRVDDECTSPLSLATENLLIEGVRKAMKGMKVIVLSDYNKGVLSRSVLQAITVEAVNHKQLVIVDPKGDDFTKYEGATLIKPNAEELAKATAMPTVTKTDCLAAASVLAEKIGVKNVLVTRGNKGMLLYTTEGFYEDSAHVLEVANVVGAGDTALAAFAVGVSEGLSFPDAMALANSAAAIAVSKHGTSFVTRGEIRNAFVRA
jgi:D-beta-D-heptose 7-phosphate kinase/D-beta-D-heptose 1-phosphate adenosyltransferase